MNKELSGIAPDPNIVDLYIRVSTTEQAEEGYSVGEQETRLRSYCAAMGFIINAVHVDAGYSGATIDRPGIKEVIKDCQRHICNKVIVWKLDRLSRSQKDTLVLLEDVFLANNVNFLSIMESFDTSTAFGRCMVGILAAFAQMERENIRARTMMGKYARIKEGNYNGSRCPLGYRFVNNSNELEINPYEARIVCEIFKSFLSGMSLNKIARYLEDKYGNNVRKWNGVTIHRILSNRVYAGFISSGSELYKGKHQPIITEESFNAAALILEKNKQLTKRDYTYTTKDGFRTGNLLTGLLYCGDCGARMYARKISRGNPKKRYMCHSVARASPAMIKSDNCSNRMHPYTADELDGIILGEIKRLALDRAAFDQMRVSCKDPDPEELTAALERQKEVEKQLERLLNLYQAGVFDLEEIRERMETLKDERKKIQANIETLETPAPAISAESAWTELSGLSEAIESGSAEAVHSIVHLLIDRIEVLNEDITIYWSFC